MTWSLALQQIMSELFPVQSGIFTMLVWENNDFNKETSSDQGTTDNTNGIMIQCHHEQTALDLTAMHLCASVKGGHLCSVSVIKFAESMEEITEIMHIAPEVQVQTLVRDRHIELMIKCTSEGKDVMILQECQRRLSFTKMDFRSFLEQRNALC